jgi:hypothetical protein
MAKKSSAPVPVAALVKARKLKAEESALSPTRLRASSLLDTRVVYCGDNLEQLAKLPDACVDLIYIDPPKPMQKEKCRMMKPARSAILHSSFILLNFPVPASHYVKVMPDQIFGNNRFEKMKMGLV